MSKDIARTADGPDCYELLSDVMRWILARDHVQWEAGTRLAAIDGWNSNKTVTAVIEVERRLDIELPQGAVDNVATVGELASLIKNALEGRPTPTVSARTTSAYARFESLGEDCEFGLVQQAGGVMRPHLLRFSAFAGDASERLARLTAAIEDGFADLARPDLIEIQVPEREWNGATKEYRIVNTRYGWTTHTGLLTDRIGRHAAEDRLKDFPKTIEFMRQQFIRELGIGRIVWIWKSSPASSLHSVEGLLKALRRYGPNKLLWVRRADEVVPPGTIIPLGPELISGYIWKSSDPWSGEWSDGNSWRTLIDSAAKILPNEAEDEGYVSASPRQDKSLVLLSEIISQEIGLSMQLISGMTPVDVPGWDSLKHISIIMAVERRLGRTLSPDEVDQTITIDGLAKILSYNKL